jgi:hypothetical protein
MVKLVATPKSSIIGSSCKQSILITILNMVQRTCRSSNVFMYTYVEHVGLDLGFDSNGIDKINS